jgi:excisionase family DNA binding protein
MTPLPTHGWVNADQLAEHLGVSRETVLRWKREQGLPAVTIGQDGPGRKTVRFNVGEVFAWLDEHREVTNG